MKTQTRTLRLTPPPPGARAELLALLDILERRDPVRAEKAAAVIVGHLRRTHSLSLPDDPPHVFTAGGNVLRLAGGGGQ